MKTVDYESPELYPETLVNVENGFAVSDAPDSDYDYVYVGRI